MTHCCPCLAPKLCSFCGCFWGRDYLLNFQRLANLPIGLYLQFCNRLIINRAVCEWKQLLGEVIKNMNRVMLIQHIKLPVFVLHVDMPLHGPFVKKCYGFLIIFTVLGTYIKLWDWLSLATIQWGVMGGGVSFPQPWASLPDFPKPLPFILNLIAFQYHN